MISSRRVRSWRTVTLAVAMAGPCLLNGHAVAQDYAARSTSFGDQYHTAWTFREGVPAGLVHITQTSDGFLWLASETGLYRFDGVEFVKYHPPPGQSLVNDGAITALTATADGGLWIAYRFGGASFIRTNAIANYPPTQDFAQAIYALVQDQDGNMWGASSIGLMRFDGSRWGRIDQSWGFLFEQVVHLRVDPEGTLWVDDGKRYYVLPRGFKQFRATGIRTGKVDIARDGRGWAAVDGVGLIQLRRSDRDGWTEGQSMIRENIAALTDTVDGSLWFGAHDGIWRIDGQAARSAFLPSSTAQRFHKEDGLSDDFVYELMQDREGSVWAITPRGLDQFRRSVFTTTNLSSDMLRLSIVNEGDSILVGSGFSAKSMLVRITERGSEPIRTPFKEIHVMFRDREGVVWINADGKLWSFIGNKLTLIPGPQDYPSSANLVLQSMTMDGAGALWVSIPARGPKGIYRYDHGSWIPFRDVPDLSNPTAVNMMTDGLGHVWMGFAQNRLAIVAENTTRHYGRDSGLDVGAITAMTEHGDHVWIGGTEGLDYFSNGRFQQIVSDTGARLSGVTGIVETRGGDIWLNCAVGIVQLDAAEVHAALISQSHRAKVRIFNQLDGYPGTPIVRRQTSSVTQTADGRIFFLARAGVVWIDPDHIEKNTVPPNTFVTSVIVDQHAYENPASLNLPEGAQNLQINYTATSLLIPGKVQFRYKLEGFDKDWQEVGTRRQAFYMRLPPGHYTFLVTASNNDGVWSKSNARWEFVLPPTFLQSLWFKLICIAIFLLVLTALYLFRVKQLTAQIRSTLFTRLAERERIARDLHDTSFQGIQGLFLRFNTGTAQLPLNEPARQIFIEALEQSDRVMLEGRELVLDLRADETAASDLPEAFARAADEFASHSKPEFKVIVVGQTRQLHPVCATELFRIGKEAVYNAFRHAAATAVEVEVLYEQDVLQLRIRDNGQGMDERVLRDGRRPGHLGLPGMSERAQRIGAKFNIWSKKGNGTEIEITVAAGVAYAASRDIVRSGWLSRWNQRSS